MSSAAGLSRRRVATASTSSVSGDDQAGASRNTNGSSNGTVATHAGSAFEGGNKVAFDPRDLDQDKEDSRYGGKMPRLTIMEEVLLLGLKDKHVRSMTPFCIRPLHPLRPVRAISAASALGQRPGIPGVLLRINSSILPFRHLISIGLASWLTVGQGYLSFWNDSISYALRGCILIELALRRRIALVRDANRRRNPLPDRLVEVIDDRHTGETILDETLKMMKAQEGDKFTINSWIDLLSGEYFNRSEQALRRLSAVQRGTFTNRSSPGETWNVMKIGYQLKQVRERLAKGLVDKGVLRTEKRNFLLFDMATHPVADVRTKESIVSRVVSLLTATTSTVSPNALDKEGTQCRVTRAMCLACAAYAASVLDNAFGRLTYEDREAAFQRCDEVLAEFACWPFGSNTGPGTASGRRREAVRIGMGSALPSGRESVLGLVQEVKREMNGEEDLSFELIAGVLEVLSKLDSLL